MEFNQAVKAAIAGSISLLLLRALLGFVCVAAPLGVRRQICEIEMLPDRSQAVPLAQDSRQPCAKVACWKLVAMLLLD